MAIKVNKPSKTSVNEYTPKEMFERADVPRFYVDRDGALVFVPKFWEYASTMWGVYSLPLTYSSFTVERASPGEVARYIEEEEEEAGLIWAGPYREVDVEITYNEIS